MKPCDRNLTRAESAQLDALALMAGDARAFAKLLGKVSTALAHQNALQGHFRPNAGHVRKTTEGAR